MTVEINGSSPAYVASVQRALGQVISAPALGQVATRTIMADALDTGNKQYMGRTGHFLRAKGGVQSLKVVFPNFYVAGSPKSETAPGGTLSVTASIEYPEGTFTQVTFSASATGTVPNGGMLVSDAVAVNIPEGAYFFVRTWASGAVGVPIVSSGAILSVANGEASNAAASGLTDKTMGGALTTFGGGQFFYGPCAIIGQTSSPCVALLGDSRCAGFADVVTGANDFGALARSIGPTLAYINMGVSGDTAAGCALSYTNRAALAAYCSHAVIEHGINDLAGGGSAATLQTNITTIKNALGGMPVYLATIEPYSTSTDNWLTAANQTAFANNAARATYNTWAKTVPTGFTGYFDMAGALEATGSKWRIDPAAVNIKWFTNDGLHPNQMGYMEQVRLQVVNPGRFARVA